jgi:signal transduction histidine kinase
MTGAAPSAAHTPTDVANLVERLSTLRTLSGAPRPELEWLATHGIIRRFAAGETVSRKSEPINGLYIMFSGHVAIWVDRGAGRRKVMEWRGGDMTGLLPYSRMTYPPGDTVTDEAAELLVVDRSLFPELTRECPWLTATSVHLMLDRARAFQSSDLMDEKLVSLGKLAAGLAHELNNPASAAARSAKLLAGGLAEADRAARALGSAALTDEQHALLDGVRALCQDAGATLRAPLERADREEAMAQWLERHGADPGAAASLAETGVTFEALDELAAALSGRTLDAALRWLAAGCAVRALASDIEKATTRAHELVAAVKGFTHMDRAAVAEPIDIGPGIADTLRVLGSKARAKSVGVRVELEPDLPRVEAVAGELNQVWSNLLDNALDAVPHGGQVVVHATRDHGCVLVKVIDNGPGIPEELHVRIFDPFFTTKPVGQGTGLGLDIARRAVRRHNGEITLTSQPGRTEFSVSLPASRE